MADEQTLEIPNIQIALPTVDTPAQNLPVPAEPPAPVSTYVEQLATASPAPEQGLVCLSLLQGPSLQQAKAEARTEYAKMLDDQSKTMSFGIDALKGLNALVDRLLKEVEPIRIPELHGMMKDLNLRMNAIKGHYDLNDEKFKKEYSDYLQGVKRMFRKAKDFLAMMKADVLSIEKQLELLEKQLAGKQHDMTRNVVYYNQLYKENEAAIIQLIYKIAVMEEIVTVAKQDAQSITVGESSLGDRGEEQRLLRADIITTMENKIADFKGRLFVAWATSPQTRMMRMLDVGMANKLNQLVQVTIPQMKLVLVQWRMMLATYENAQLAEAVSAMSNQWTQEFFKQGAEMMPKIAEVINKPIMWPATMNSIATSLDQAATGILAAYEAGADRRAEVDKAMIESQQILSDTNRKIDATIIGQVVSSATKPVPIEITTTVPKALPSAG